MRRRVASPYPHRVTSDQPSPWAAYLTEVANRPGWSVARIARESGLDKSTIFRWKSGATGATVDSVKKIARAVGDDPEVVLRAAAITEIEEPRADDPDAEAIALIRSAQIPDSLKLELIADLRRESRQDAARRRNSIERALNLRTA
jgi:transcriptional regulator with XRE-family HTH domain